MLPMPIADFAAISRQLAESGRRVHVMWQTPESLAFASRLGVRVWCNGSLVDAAA